MRKCAVPDCAVLHLKDGVSLHRFPLQKEVLLSDWLKAIDAKDFRPTRNSYLCSRHFKAEDFEPSKQKRLKPNAVPSLYLSPPSVGKQKKPKKIAFLLCNVLLDHTYCQLPKQDDLLSVCELVSPWQSRVIEACFTVPVICDLGEEDSSAYLPPDSLLQ